MQSTNKDQTEVGYQEDFQVEPSSTKSGLGVVTRKQEWGESGATGKETSHLRKTKRYKKGRSSRV